METAQPFGERLMGNAQRPRQRAGGKRIGDVVPAADRQLIDAQKRGPALGHHPCGHAEILAGSGRIQSERNPCSAGLRHGEGAAIVTVQNLDTRADEDARLRGAVLGKARISIEVILREVEHRGGIRVERPGRLELVTRQLKHPGRRWSGSPQ